MASRWSPEQYERFKDERSKPFYDLVALVRPREGMRVVDLGCGTGELTRALHQSLKARETVGVDASESMLAKSAAFAGEGLRFERARIEDARLDGPFDLVFSNAALQWVDDHPALLARLASMLSPGGQIAVQIPQNDDHPSHTVAAEVAREAPFAGALAGYTRTFPNLSLAAYATHLDALGFVDQDVSMRVYAHRLAGREEVVEWVKGTLLTDYERRLSADLWPRFLARYREKLFDALEDRRPLFYPFKRVLFWGQT
jgi:trans-aconitate 2-methyltransferase